MDMENIINVEIMTEEEISAAWSIYEQAMLASLQGIPTEELLTGKALSAVQEVEPRIIFPGDYAPSEYTGENEAYRVNTERTLKLVDRKYIAQHEILINTLIVRILKMDKDLTVEQVRKVFTVEDIHVGTSAEELRSAIAAHFKK